MPNTRFPIIACVLRSGGGFTKDHVLYLALQVEKAITVPYQFLCVTDIPLSIPGVLTLPLRHKYPGWWSKIELFRIPGVVIAFDLDTMFYGNIDSFIIEVSEASEDKFWMLRSFRPPTRGISGVMAWNGDRRSLYYEFNPEKDITKFRGDENYTTAKLKKNGFPISFVQDSLDGVYSWKRHCKGTVPEDCSILVFHGEPRPWKVDSLWEPMINQYKR